MRNIRQYKSLKKPTLWLVSVKPDEIRMIEEGSRPQGFKGFRPMTVDDFCDAILDVYYLPDNECLCDSQTPTLQIAYWNDEDYLVVRELIGKLTVVTQWALYTITDENRKELVG